MKFMPTPPAVLALSIALLLASCGGGGGSSSNKNKVVPQATACPSGPGTIANTTCQVLRVVTRGNPDMNVELRVTEPDPQAVALGTVVLSSGGLGNTFYAEQGGGDLLVQQLSDAGWRVVDRKWEGGWFTTGTSVRNQSRRYAVLLEWIEKKVHLGGDLVASGNSGGASEIAYALTTWPQGALLQNSVLTAGPVMSRLDYLCTSPPTAEWASQCAALVPPGSLSCGAPECSRTNAPACAYLDPGATPEELAEDSILHQGALLDFGGAHVHVALGADDCTTAAPQALLFESQIASRSTLEFVPNTPYEVASTQAGRDAIVAALVNYSLPAPAVPPVVRERLTILGGEGDVTVIERQAPAVSR